MESTGEHLGSCDSGVPSLDLTSARSSGGKRTSDYKSASENGQNSNASLPLRIAQDSRSATKNSDTDAGNLTQGSSQGIRPPSAEDIFNLRGTSGQAQKGISALFMGLLSHTRQPETQSSPSSPYHPYPNPVSPPILLAPNQAPGPRDILPVLYSYATSEGKLPVLPKTPNISELAPRLPAYPFGLRK